MKYIAVIVASIVLLVPGSALAFSTLAPGIGETNVKVNSHFQWEPVGGATKYVLDITKFTQSEDNIPSSVCDNEVCAFSFLSLSIGRITHANAYTWKVTAYNAAGNPIDDSNVATFSTEQPPEVVVVPPDQGGGPGSGGGPIIDPSDFNPISSQNLGELFEAIRNFLFGLSLVILPIVILYGGFLMLTARGDPEKISRSRTVLLWAVIAFIIILVAGGLPAVIRDLL